MGDDISVNIKEIGWEDVDCSDVLRVGTSGVLYVLLTMTNFWPSCGNRSISRRILLHGVI